MTVRTRFAPSPTGYLHIGGARTALFSWLYARKHQGKFVLRIEDTDRERSTQESVDAILLGMEWLGLNYDEGPFFQTQRFDRYKEVIQYLLDEGKAYRCYCSREELDSMRAEQQKNKQKPRYDGRYRDYTGPIPQGIEPVIRFKNPLDGQVTINDAVVGEVVVNNQELDDLIIARSDGTPTYNLTVVVDDLDMNITHVIRGDDHLNNTPRQINLFEALGGKLPIFAHVPMILGNDGKRMSKRHGAVSVSNYNDDGYLADALVNYLVRLGWSHGDQEIFSRQDMIDLFSLEHINKSAAGFDIDKLLWLNQHYIKTSNTESLADLFNTRLLAKSIHAKPQQLNAVVKVQQDRSKTLKEMVDTSEYFFTEFDAYEEKAAKKFLKESSLPVLNDMRDRFTTIADWSAENIHAEIDSYAEEAQLKFGKIAPALRVAACGISNSPSIDITLQLIGKDTVLTRMQKAIDYIKSNIESNEA